MICSPPRARSIPGGAGLDFAGRAGRIGGMRLCFRTVCVVTLALYISAEPTVAERPPSWVGPMRELHAGFEGKEGYVAQFGDSITHSMAFWSVMSWTNPDEYLAEVNDGNPARPKSKRWRDRSKKLLQPSQSP